MEVLLVGAARVDPDVRVWRGDLDSGPSERVGTPVGTREFVLEQLQSKIDQHATFFEQNSGHSGSPVRMALVVVLRCCASQLLLEDQQPIRSGTVSVCWWVLIRRSSGPHKRRFSTSGSWRFGPSQRGQVEARSSLGQLGGQFEDDQ